MYYNETYLQWTLLVLHFGEPTGLINEIAPLCNSASGCMPLTTSIPFSGYVIFIHYIHHFLTHSVDMPYSYKSCRLKDLKDEMKQN